jgi:hypothetical protein
MPAILKAGTFGPRQLGDRFAESGKELDPKDFGAGAPDKWIKRGGISICHANFVR